MAPKDIAEHLRRQPFEPLRIHLTTGETFDVHKRWQAAISVMEMWIGIDPDADGIPTRSVYADLRHIALIEPLRNGPTQRGNGSPCVARSRKRLRGATR